MQNKTQRLEESDRARPPFYEGAGINKQENEIFLTKRCTSWDPKPSQVYNLDDSVVLSAFETNTHETNTKYETNT